MTKKRTKQQEVFIIRGKKNWAIGRLLGIRSHINTHTYKIKLTEKERKEILELTDKLIEKLKLLTWRYYEMQIDKLKKS